MTTVSDTTVKLVATAVPKRTFPVPMNPDPVIVTKVPPASGPEAGATDVTTGVGASYVNRSFVGSGALVPWGVVTETV